jgi:hypothetical protein
MNVLLVEDESRTGALRRQGYDVACGCTRSDALEWTGGENFGSTIDLIVDLVLPDMAGPGRTASAPWARADPARNPQMRSSPCPRGDLQRVRER